MKEFVKHAKQKQNLKGAIRVGLVVGTMLGIINHYDMFISGNYETRRIIQIILTYLIPFFVSLHGRATFGRHFEKNKEQYCKQH